MQMLASYSSPTAAFGTATCSPAWRTSVPTVTATAAGTPALAMPEMSCLRVIATLFLFLLRWLELLRMRPVGRNACNASLHAALEPLRCHPCRSTDRASDSSNEGGGAN